MKSRPGGFTLTEMAIAILALGLLAATAIPRVVERRDDARVEVEAVAETLASASAINYAVRRLGTGNGVPVADCRDVVKAIDTGLDPGYEIVAAGVAAGATASCTVRRVDDEALVGSFIVHGID